MCLAIKVVSLTDNEKEYVANHLGHTMKVHKDYYRLSDATIELAKVSKLLIASEQGTIGTLVGKNLDQITIDG